ncbi:MAG: zinc-ribbon domain-containing protein [Candidatus Thermoplasmatota archaeon]|nr:zinc-ribbon domain-containing protein [Candidatus Thermoplasmatota archaeon]
MKTCTRCGQENPDESTFCGRCGVSLAEAAPAGPAPPAQPPGAQPPYPQYAPPYPQYVPPPYPQYVRRRRETKLAVAGGVLVLVGGILALITSFVGLILFSLFYGDYYGGLYYYPYNFGLFQAICGVVGLAFAIIAIVGGYFAIKRRNFAMAVVGAVFCMLSIGSMGISSILGLVGLILIAVSSHEFR